MTNSIQYLPRDILGQTFSSFDKAEDLIVCTSTCKKWYETIKTDSISKQLIRNLFSESAASGTTDNFYTMLRALLLSIQTPDKLKIQSTELDQLNALAVGFKEMGRFCDYHSDYQTKISDKLDQLPTKIQEKLYDRLWKVCKSRNRIVYDFPGWGKTAFHSPDHRRNLPSCSLRREVVLAQLEEQQLSTLADTLMLGASERSKEKAIKQFSQLPAEIKNDIYQRLEQLLTQLLSRQGSVHHESGKTAFYDSTVPKVLKGAAINLYLSDLQRQ